MSKPVDLQRSEIVRELSNLHAQKVKAWEDSSFIGGWEPGKSAAYEERLRRIALLGLLLQTSDANGNLKKDQPEQQHDDH